jgi:hypothetical protein
MIILTLLLMETKFSIQYFGQQESTVRVFNSIGQLVYTKDILTYPEMIHLGELKPGMYIVALTANNIMFSKQVIVN